LKPFHLNPIDKEAMFIDKMDKLTKYHLNGCEFYRDYLSAINACRDNYSFLSEIPFIPARFFKDFTLRTGVAEANAIASSSGTSGAVSQISLNHRTMLAQSLALNSIVKSFIGNVKLPMLIFEPASIATDKKTFNARAAGVLGFTKFASKTFYAFFDDGEIDHEAVEDFYSEVGRFGGGLAFGFTSVIWEAAQGLDLQINSGSKRPITLIHGGGWKKLAALNISSEQFNTLVSDRFQTTQIHNYYGMVEQTGSVFFECSSGRMHASAYSEVIIRDPLTLDVLPAGVEGVIQVFSSLPESYPGHSILTEDVGVLSEDELCECGRFGSGVKVVGRLPDAEIRGCSDVYG
jgi:hypothetical protein